MEKNNKQNIYKIVMLVLLTAIVTFLLTTLIMYNKFQSSSLEINSSTSGKIEESTSLIKTLKEFKAVFQEKYIGEVNDNDLLDGAIKGYVAGLGDPYTQYLDKEEMADLIEETNSKYVGIGVYVANNTQDNTILIVGVMKGSPALDAQIQAGDILEKVDGVAYTGEQLTEATKILKGEENTNVKVTIIRDGKEIDLDVTRKTIIVEHVEGTMLESNIGYIQIDSFDDGVAKRFEEETKKLQEQGMKSLIIDLRSNGGGIVNESTDIADLFIEKNEPILIQKNNKDKEEITKSEKEPIIKNIPVVVLVNEGTASASEILAGALKDKYENTTIVGKTTYGKGVIQTLFSLKDGTGLKVTTDEYYTPNHNKINKIGIVPDLEINLTKDEKGVYETSKEKDAQLKKAIEILTK